MAFQFPFQFKLPKGRTPEYPDDIFDGTRMSFGDHIEELRSRLLKALYGLGFFLIIGFVLDMVGKEVLGNENFGIGIPMMKVITEPVETEVANFYRDRNIKSKAKMEQAKKTTEADLDVIRQRLNRDYKPGTGMPDPIKTADPRVFTKEERQKLQGVPVEMDLVLPLEPFNEVYGTKPMDLDKKEIKVTAKVYAGQINTLSTDGETGLGTRHYLTTLSPQEAFMVYFKVSLLCGVVLASPWIFYHLWAFISAGLYPHEKRYIHLFLPISVGLFLAGVCLCQFVVLPGSVKTLLSFNEWLDLDPELRVNEWLSFALILPVVFGLSFQAPLIMFFLCRIRLFTYKTYLGYWKAAVMILMVLAAAISPTPDVVTLLYLQVPMLGLYFVGILVCYLFPPPAWDEEDQAEAQVAV